MPEPVFAQTIFHIVGNGSCAIVGGRVGQNEFGVPSCPAEADDSNSAPVDDPAGVKHRDGAVPDIHIEGRFRNTPGTLKPGISLWGSRSPESAVDPNGGGIIPRYRIPASAVGWGAKEGESPKLHPNPLE